MLDGLVDVLDGLLVGWTVEFGLLLQDHGVPQQGPDTVRHRLPYLGPHIAALQTQHNLKKDAGSIRRQSLYLQGIYQKCAIL